jgi:hypothetical protein
MGGGFCLFNNVAVAALHALEGSRRAELAEAAAEAEAEAAAAAGAGAAAAAARASPSPSSSLLVNKVAIVDFDVHHGDGTQEIFYSYDRVLFISLHQDGNYPLHSGKADEAGDGAGKGLNINVPLLPGSGSGAYRAAFDRIVSPALDLFRPDLVLASAGYDASYADPIGQMMLGSEDFRFFMASLRASASRHARGRLVAVHEGGYSDSYVPFCGLAAIEALCGPEAGGVRSRVRDPFWADVSGFAHQALQPWQDAALRKVEEGPMALLRARCSGSNGAAGSAAGRGRGRPAAAAAAARPTLPGGGGGSGKAGAAPPEATGVVWAVSPALPATRAAAGPGREPEAACG